MEYQVVMDVVDFSKEVFDGKFKLNTNFIIIFTIFLSHRNLEYVCKEGGKCIIDVSRRNQCQSCRFSKCIEANMRREGEEEVF